MPKNPQVRQSIQLILENLVNYPEYVEVLLDRFFNEEQMIRPVYDVFQIGFDNYVDLVYRTVSIWRASGKNIPATLLENGLIEEFADLDPDDFKEILDVVQDHPLFLSRQKSGFSIIKDLNDTGFLWACHRNPELVRKISEKLSYYISLPKNNELKAQSFEALVSSMVNLSIATKDDLAPLFTPTLIGNIHDLPNLRKFTNSKRLFTNAAEHQKSFQSLAGKILEQDQDLLHQVAEDIINYTTLPAAGKDNDAEKRIIQEKWEDMILSIVELGSKPDVRDTLKEFATEELVNDLYDTAGFKNAQYTRKLVTDLAKDNPQGFKELFGAILAKPYNSSLAPLTKHLLTYFSSTTAQVKENPKIATNLLDSLVKLAHDPEVAAKIAPLLSENLVDNVFATFALDKYSEYKPLITDAVQKLSKQPETLGNVIKAYEQYRKNNIEGTLKILEDDGVIAVLEPALKILEYDNFIATIASDDNLELIVAKLSGKNSKESEIIKDAENLLADMPEILAVYRKEFIKAVGEAEYLTMERSIQSAADIAKSHKNVKETNSEQQEKPAKKNQYTPLLRKFATMQQETHGSIINGINNPKIEPFIKNILERTQNNKHIEELQFFGVDEKDIINFAKKACNPSGLTAIADYLEEPKGLLKNIKLAKICVVTGNVSFALKHLTIGLGNYLKSISRFSTQEKSDKPKKEMSMVEKVLESRRLADNSKNLRV